MIVAAVIVNIMEKHVLGVSINVIGNESKHIQKVVQKLHSNARSINLKNKLPFSSFANSQNAQRMSDTSNTWYKKAVNNPWTTDNNNICNISVWF